MKILYLILCIAIITSCGNDDAPTAPITDIAEHQWILSKIALPNYERVVEPSPREEVYLLEFLSDSMYNFHNSVNEAGGKYKIEDNILTVQYYQTFTEACCENEMEEKLLKVFPTATSYTVRDKTMDIQVEDGYLRFSKK